MVLSLEISYHWGIYLFLQYHIHMRKIDKPHKNIRMINVVRVTNYAHRQKGKI